MNVLVDGLTDAAKEEDDRLAGAALKGSERSITSCATGFFPGSDIGASRFPILHFADGTKRALELDELPLCLRRA